jgi:hypothetical protein
MANTIMHEVKHLRHYNKYVNKLGEKAGRKAWNDISTRKAEQYATSMNITQGKKLGMDPGDLKIFEDYHRGYRE